MSGGQSQTLVLPVDVVRTPGALPPYCSRHGAPAARRVDFVLQSRVKVDGNRALSGNVLSTTDRLAQRGAKVRVSDVRGWPLCGACVRVRTVGLALAVVLFWGGLLAFAGALIAGLVGDVPSALAVVAVLGFVAMVVSPFALHLGALGRIVRARVSDDGQSVVVESPSAAFAAGSGR